MFELSEEQSLVQDTARRFAEEDIAPTLEEEEKKHEFRADRVRRMGELGFFACALPDELGGNGMGFLESVLMAEQVARVSASWRVQFNMQNLGPTLTVAKFGSSEQKEKYIPGWISGEKLGFFAMTEPNSGSDVASMSTVARDAGDHWELRGSKIWISNAHMSVMPVSFMPTRTRKPDTRGFLPSSLSPGTLKVVPRNPLRPNWACTARRPGSLSSMAQRFPRMRFLAMKVMVSRPVCGNSTIRGSTVAAGALGVAGGALELAINYANERTQFGKPISKHQMVQAQIAEMAVEHEAAKLLVYRAAWLKDQNRPNQYETSVAKLAASEAAVHAANECMKIFGSYGFSTEYPAERFYRDSKSLQVVEGTSNVQKMIISGVACGFNANR